MASNGLFPPCHHRQETGADKETVYECGFVRDLGSNFPRFPSRVSSEACQECYRWGGPTSVSCNPVLASLVYSATTEVLSNDNLSATQMTSAEALKSSALLAIADADGLGTSKEIAERQFNLELASPAEIVPPLATRPSHRIREWAVGVTTTAGRRTTLSECLSCLAEAGWRDPRLFSDGGVVPEIEIPTTHRKTALGAWPSYFLALSELLMRHPSAEAFALVQDDVILFRHRKLRHYLEEFLWPNEDAAIASLYCSAAYTAQTAGWHQLEEPLTWGAQALIFSREAVIRFLSDEAVLRHRMEPNGHACIDSVIGRWAAENEIPIWLPTPSLAQHVGHESTVWHGARLAGNRRADRFAGNRFS